MRRRYDKRIVQRQAEKPNRKKLGTLGPWIMAMRGVEVAVQDCWQTMREASSLAPKTTVVFIDPPYVNKAFKEENKSYERRWGFRENNELIQRALALHDRCFRLVMTMPETEASEAALKRIGGFVQSRVSQTNVAGGGLCYNELIITNMRHR